MNTNLGYSKKTLTDTNVLLSGGGDKPLSDFIGSISWDATNKKITYTPVGGSATNLVSFGSYAFKSSLGTSDIPDLSSKYVPYETTSTRASVDSTNSTPIIYNLQSNNLVSGYKNFWHVINLGRYDGNEKNYASQIAMNYEDSISDTDMFIRTARNTTWRAWRKVLHSGNSYVSSGVGIINGTTITLVSNADTVDDKHYADIILSNGRNLVRSYDIERTSSGYQVWPTHVLTETVSTGDKITITIEYSLSSDATKTWLTVYTGGGYASIATFTATPGLSHYVESKTTTMSYASGNNDNGICIYYGPSGNTGTATIHRVKVERGDHFTGWTAAPEDLIDYYNNQDIGGVKTITSGIKWKNETALPEQTSPQYFLVLDTFSSGGRTKWSSIANIKTALGLGSNAYTSEAYVEKAGDTMTGMLTIKNNSWNNILTLNRTSASGTWGPAIVFQYDGTSNGTLTMTSNQLYIGDSGSSRYKAWHEGNDGTGSGLDADLLDGLHGSSFVKFYLSPSELGSNAPAANAKTWFVKTMPSSSGAIVYNVPGSEKTIIAGKSSGSYGHLLMLGYDDTYLRMLRYKAGTWQSTDWEKISAGYADSAGNSDTLGGNPASAFLKVVPARTINTTNAAPNAYVWLCRVGNSGAYSGLNLILRIVSRYDALTQTNIRIETGSPAYGTSLITGYVLGRIYNAAIYYVKTSNSSGYDYYDLYAAVSTWNIFNWDILQVGTNGTFELTYKETFVDSLPSGANTFSERVPTHNHNSILDINNNTAITFAYSSGGFNTTPDWLAAWNGYQLTYVAPSAISVKNADTVDGRHSTGFCYWEGNPGKNNMNDIARLFYSATGMTNLISSTVDNGDMVGWTHFISTSYLNGGGGTNSWIFQLACPAGSSNLQFRSRNGGTITDGASWTTDWTKILHARNYKNYCDGNYVKDGLKQDQDFNIPDDTYSGIYIAHNLYTQSNKPDTYGLIANFTTLGGHLLFWGGAENDIKMRSYWWTKNPSGFTYPNWVTLIHSGNIGSQSVDKVDGWHKDDLVWSGYVTSGTASLSSYWFKAWTCTITGYQYNDLDLILLVSSAYTLKRGIIHIRIRQQGANNGGAYNFTKGLWLITGNIPLANVRLYCNNSTGVCELWMNVVEQYGVYNYTVIKKTWRTSTDITSFGTLTASNFTTAQTVPEKSDSCIEMSLSPQINGLTDFSNYHNGKTHLLSISVGDVNKKVAPEFLAPYSGLTYGNSGLQYFNINGTEGKTANANVTPRSAYYHILRMNHANNDGYFADIAVPLNDVIGIYWRLVRSGTNYGWYKLLDSNNWYETVTTIKHTFTASGQGPVIKMDGANYDNYLWLISSGTTTNQYFGYALKYIGTGSGVDNKLRLLADNQNSTDVTAIGINQNGEVGIGRDPSLGYRLTVGGKGYFSNQIISGVSTGTAPFSISSKTKVTNLSADMVDGYDVSDSSTNFMWGSIAPVKNDGVMDIGKYIDFHNESNNGVDYNVRLQCPANTGSIVVYLPSSAGTLALTNHTHIVSGTASSLAALDVSKSFIYVTLSANVAASSFTLNGPMTIGQCLTVLIYNSSSSTITIGVPTDWKSLDGYTLSCGATKFLEISIVRYDGDNVNPKFILSSKAE